MLHDSVSSLDPFPYHSFSWSRIIPEGRTKAGTPISTTDIWIAASAMQHGLRLLTRDVHYRNVLQVLVDYVEAS